MSELDNFRGSALVAGYEKIEALKWDGPTLNQTTFRDTPNTDAADAVLAPATPPKVSIGGVTVTEPDTGSVEASVTATLAGKACGRPVKLNFATADGSAKSGEDYSAKSGGLTFDPGQVSQEVPVSVLADNQKEPTEAFNVNLTESSGALPVNAPDLQENPLASVRPDIVGPGGVVTILDNFREPARPPDTPDNPQVPAKPDPEFVPVPSGDFAHRGASLTAVKADPPPTPHAPQGGGPPVQLQSSAQAHSQVQSQAQTGAQSLGQPQSMVQAQSALQGDPVTQIQPATQRQPAPMMDRQHEVRVAKVRGQGSHLASAFQAAISTIAGLVMCSLLTLARFRRATPSRGATPATIQPRSSLTRGEAGRARARKRRLS